MFRLFATTARRSGVTRITNRLRLRLEHLETRDTPSTTVAAASTAPADDTGPDPVVAQPEQGGSNWNPFGYGDEGDNGGQSSNSTLSISIGFTEQGGLYFITGSVSDDESVEGLSVSIGGSLPGASGSATVGSNGTFSLCINCSPGDFGTVRGSVSDAQGHSASSEIVVSV